MNQDNTWAVIPAYNEEKDIWLVIRGAKDYIKNIIVVDDGSKDRTYYIAKDIAKKEDVIVLRHIINLGKGAALKTGCDFALKKGADNIVVLDADAQHEPSNIPDFLKELKKADVVLGYRVAGKEMPPVLKFGNWFINQMTKLLYGINVHDTQCGFRAFTSKAYRKIRWESSNYSMESEMIANIGKADLSFSEVPIKTIYADKYKGTTVIDGIKIAYNLIWWRFSR